MLPRTRRAALAAVAVTIVGARPILAQDAAPVTVRGVAYDSLTAAPLAEAVVTIVGTARSVRTDSRGRFQLDGVPPGVYTFAAQHAALDSLGFSGISARAAVTDGREEVRLATPSFTTLWRAACGAGPVPRDSGFVYGSVRDAIARTPAPGATVDITWLDLQVTRARRVTESWWRGRAMSDSTGSYAICGVPVDVGLRIRAVKDSSASGLVDLPGRGARLQRRDLVIGPVTDTLAPARGTIVGSVRDSAGRPVPEARVIADGVPELRSDPEGRFTARGVPAGSRQVEVTAIGMSPVVVVVDVSPRDTVSVAAVMRRITVLDVVRVTASPLVRRLVTELEERRKLGAGHVRDSTQIAVHGTLFSLFFDFPNVRPERVGSGNAFIVTLPGTNGRCLANVVIDARKSDYDELNFLRPSEIAAIEVYPRRLSAPAQFIRNESCGAVVVWTKWALAS